MADNRNFAALEWVVGEIDETLKQARQSLEAYVENPQDSTRIRFCLTHIHQVHGSLQMVEFFGAALLAEEMEAIAQALMNGEVNNDAEAHEVLMRAILQLPIYLEQVKSKRNDDPGSLLPLLNDLRAARGSSLLSESQFFSPDISPAKKVGGEKNAAQSNPAQFKAVMQKLRQMYQYAAAGVIKSVKVDENLKYLEKVFSRLHLLTSGTARQPLWDIALAVVEGLDSEHIQISVSLKTLMRQLDKEIHLLAEHGTKALNSFTREELIKNLLYYVARSKAETPRTQRIRQQYALDEALPDQQASDSGESSLLNGPDPETMRTVVAALNDELAAIKDALDVGVDDLDARAVDEALQIMKRVADTLAVLGVADLRKQVLDQANNLESAAAQNDVSSEVLMAVADEIIAVEQRLAVLATAQAPADSAQQSTQQVQINQAQETVLREARNGLEQAKDSIIEYIASQWERSHLSNVPKLLEEIRGGLGIIPLDRPAAILQGCSQYIENELLSNDASPEWSALDTLADAIASVEYFLERISGDREDDDEVLLTLAEESIASLGYGVEGVTAKAIDKSSANAESVLEKIADVESVSIDALPEDSASDDRELELSPDELPEEPTSATQLLVDADSQSDSVVDNEIEDSSTAFASFDDVVTDHVEAEDAETVPTLTADAVEDQGSDSDGETDTTVSSDSSDVEDEDEIDDEILEIFIEEAGEVLEAIDEFFPQWAADFDDSDSLTEFRRAFHTLKGSGRMVGANDIGELAWSIESMLNRVLEGGIKPHAVQVALITQVRAALPKFIDAFEHKQPNPDPQHAQQLIEWGEAILRGELPNELLVADTGSTEASSDGAADESSAIASETAQEESTDDSSATDLNDRADDDGNDILWEIFGSEAVSHLQVVEGFIDEMQQAKPLYTPPSEAMQRALHTLKGSAHMADVHDIAMLATPLEQFAKELRTYQVNIDDDILQLFCDGVLYIHDALHQIRTQGQAEIAKLGQFSARVAELRDLFVGPLIRQQAERKSKAVDPELLSIFMAEEMNLLLDADEIVEQWRIDPQQPAKIDALITELNTLAKGAEHACLPPMAQISQCLSNLYSSADRDLSFLLDEDYTVLLQAHEQLLDMVDAVAAGQNVQPVNEELHQRLADIQQRLDTRTQGASVEADNGGELSDDVTSDVVEASAMVETVQGLAGSIEVIDVGLDDELDDDIAEGFIDAVGEDLQVLESVDLSSDMEEPGTSNLDDENELSSSAAVELEPTTEQWQSSLSDAVSEPTVENRLEEDSFSVPERTVAAETVEVVDEDDDIDPDIIEIFLEEADELMEDIERSVHEWSEDWGQNHSCEELKRALHTLKGGARLSGMTAVGDVSHDFETDVIHTSDNHAVDDRFFERCHKCQDLLLKGIELVKQAMAGNGQLAVALKGQAIYSDAPDNKASEDTVISASASDAPSAADDLPESDATAERTTSVEQINNLASESAEILPFLPKDNVPVVSSGDDFQMPATSSTPSASTPAPSGGGVASNPMQARRNAPQEVVKVSAELLEELVNLAGETSISRGRMEEQVSELGFAIDEMDSTINRLQEQLRRLDIETQAQMLFRQEQMAEMEEFDPLEMDRYSQLQQLSRSLIESASDLMDLKATLSDKTRDTETLLLQQSRINTDLQEGLMRSRMVPFARLVPRLRRIVRQVASELDKRVDFELDNVEGELDRTVLERMVAPLEHMLRNAVDHGIETPEERIAKGKPEAGRVVLTLTREGGDVMLRLIDDGRGIDLERVKAKAIERGLMSEEANLSDRDIMQFILHAGFSTAESVTQISGRGVGMDVVHSEIKQLGGAMSINSRWGEGTEFTVRLPFTVSVNRALMVRIGEDRYAVPLNTIEGIVRVSPFELEHYYQDEQARFEYAGEQYQVRYLGNLLNSDARPKLEGQAMPLPVVLVRTAQNAVAMQVDMLMGSREIVVKSLGPQFGLVQGVSGATVMGDGSVVVILDPHAMIRQEAALVHTPENLLETEPDTYEEHVKTIMVVDDSVTVRKVTSRFLEREGYEVLTAKDGADALLQLQDHIPDAMLLDIEMPRMDGFEVAKNIRSSSRLKDIPIIMITSRTGDKHRERALSLGVNKYMGKPYQEDKLLHNIRVVTGDEEDIIETDDSVIEE
ncbi:MAG: histidine kinase [Cellvibrionaceae bacterium]|nr:histidine kinase [Cellvibrionaceae bacterium]